MIEVHIATSQGARQPLPFEPLWERNVPKWASGGRVLAGPHGSKLWDCRQY